MSFLLPIQLFKILSDETRLGIVLLLSELGELCVCDLCTALDQSQPKISPPPWHCCVKAGYCWTASKVSGFITAYHRIFQHGRRKLLMRPWRCEQEKGSGDCPQPGSTKLFRGQ